MYNKIFKIILKLNKISSSLSYSVDKNMHKFISILLVINETTNFFELSPQNSIVVKYKNLPVKQNLV